MKTCKVAPFIEFNNKLLKTKNIVVHQGTYSNKTNLLNLQLKPKLVGKVFFLPKMNKATKGKFKNGE